MPRKERRGVHQPEMTNTYRGAHPRPHTWLRRKATPRTLQPGQQCTPRRNPSASTTSPPLPIDWRCQWRGAGGHPQPWNTWMVGSLCALSSAMFGLTVPSPGPQTHPWDVSPPRPIHSGTPTGEVNWPPQPDASKAPWAANSYQPVSNYSGPDPLSRVPVTYPGHFTRT